MEGMYTMRKLTLTNHAQSNTTVLENEFIDNYMAKANGEYVKVYLLLLRHLTEPSGTLTVSRIADLLEITEKDVVRALNYWKKQGLLEYESAPESGPASSSPPSDVPDIRQYRSRKEFKELLFVAEQYLGKTLSATDIEAITYFYETLHMSADLIEYLIEYCVENGHKSIHYIQKVALSWHEQEFHTVEEAKAGTQAYNRNCYSVLNAYGIKRFRVFCPHQIQGLNNRCHRLFRWMSIDLNHFAVTISYENIPAPFLKSYFSKKAPFFRIKRVTK